MFRKEVTVVGIDMDYTYQDMQNLSWEQIKKLDEIIDIGGHTHNHEIMSYLSDSG